MTESTFLSNKFKFIKRIGSGSFGEVYMVQNKNNIYAAKIEEKSRKLILKEEYNIYKKLHKNGMLYGIPEIRTYIETPRYNMLIMELLGRGLDYLLEKNNGTFDLSTVLEIGINITKILQQVHSAGIIHRDIKPNNFVIGKNDQNSLYIIDFGLSKQYITKGSHINMRAERSLVGTPRYSSINVHMGIEPSRRDDLESVGYILIYFLKGKLPWQGLKKKKKQNIQKL